MGARPVVLLAVAAGAVVLAAAVAGDDGPRPDSGSPAVSGRATTTLRPVSTTALAPLTTATVPASRATAEALGSETEVPPEAPGLVITNSGSATASVGGNVVSGGGPTATVITGDATAVGNSSSIRTP